MGKTGKKVKSDRINALRKQYDSFLEEDKRRKDRNQYILGHLQEMQLSTVLQPGRYKEKILFNYSINHSPRSQGYDKFIPTQNALLNTKHVESVGDNLILNEISKRYILIPKLQSTQNDTASYEPVKFSSISDTDWKNKYNILNELKKTEKETTSDENVCRAGINDDCKSNILIEEDQGIVHYNSSSIDKTHKTNIPIHKLQSNKTVIKEDLLDDNKLRDLDRKNNVQVPAANEDIGFLKNSVDIPNKNITKQQEYDTTKKEYPDQNTSIKVTNEHDSSDCSRKLTFHRECNDLNKHYETQDLLHENNTKEMNEDEHTTGNENILVKSSNNYEDEMDVKVSKVDETSINNEIITAPTQVRETVENEPMCHDAEPILGNTENESSEKNVEYQQNAREEVNNKHDEKQILYDEADKSYEYNNDNTSYHTENENYTKQEYTYDESQQKPYTEESEIKHEGSTEGYDANYEQQYENNFVDPNLNQYQNQEYEVGANNAYEERQGEYTNVNYEGQQDNSNFENINSENIEVTDQDQQDNIYSYENQGVHENITNENHQYEVDYPYEQQQGEYTNMNYEGQPGDNNYDYSNTDNIQVTDENLHENVYNYENQEEHEKEQHYDTNVHEEYSIPNEQDKYEDQQENISTELETEHRAEKQLFADKDYQENPSNEIINNVNDAEK